MFEWDKSKANKNLLKHGIISARKAVRSEVKQYESEI
jgi:uncharacterized DUF497 family protein